MDPTGSMSQIGILSGIGKDTINQLVQARSGTLQRLKGDQSEAEQHKGLFQSLNGKLGGLLDAAKGLNDADIFQARSASSSDTDVVKASADAEASLGSYDIDVSNRAQAHSHVVGTDDGSADGSVTEGVSDTGDASVINDGVTLSFFHEGTEHSYTTDSGTTLASLADEIDSESNGVTAEVTNIDDTGTNPQYVLKMQSETIGGGDKRITTDSGGTSPGVSIGGGSLFSAGDEQAVAQSGQNAQFTVDGVSYTRATNNVDDVLTGVTLNLTGTGTATVDVTHNTGAAAEKVQAFVDAYNGSMEFLDKNMAYDAENQKASPLTGDPTARGVERRLNAMTTQYVDTGDGNPLQTLSQVGVRMERDGTLSFDKDEFKEELESNPDDVQDLFVGDDRMAERLVSEAEGLTQAGSGIVPRQIDSLDGRLERLDSEIQAERRDLEDYRERLQEKYARLDSIMASFEYQKSALRGSLSQLSNL